MSEEYTDLRKNRKHFKNALVAEQLFPFLVGRAYWLKSTVCYDEVARFLGYTRNLNGTTRGDARNLSRVLAHIYFYCIDQGYPPLTAIVVKESTGKPGLEELTEVDTYRAMDFPWYDKKLPSAFELNKAYQEHK